MGLVINRPQTVTVHDVLKDLSLDVRPEAAKSWQDYHALSFEGGPIDPFRGFVVHDGWQIYESTMQVTPEIHLTASKDILEELAAGNGPEHFMLLLGYAGWGEGQLEQELANSDWLITSVNQHLLFQTPPEHRWMLAARSMGVDKSHLSSQAGHA